MFDIVGIDYPCVDLNINLDDLPNINGRAIIQDLSWQGGGKVSTGLIAAARLGVRCAVLGAVGGDKYGAFCKQDFERHGIDTRYLITREGASTSFTVVLSEKKTQSRRFAYYPGSSKYLGEEELPGEYLSNAKYFFISRMDPAMKRAAAAARRSGAKVFIDADTYSEEIVSYIPQTDVFVASEYVYRGMFSDESYEKNCRRVMGLGPEIVIFTLGERGAVGVSRQGFFRIPAHSVEVVDTAGAGDVFHGAFLAGLLQEDWSVSFAAEFASAVSAIKCTRIGGRAGIPSMETALKYMKTAQIDYAELDQRADYYRGGMDYV